MKKLFGFIIFALILITLVSCNQPADPDNGGSGDNTDGIPDTEHVHLFGEWYTVEEPTCQSGGYKEATCNCGEKVVDDISPTGHKMVNSACTYCKRHFSEGLKFESNGDGSCNLIGIGDCTDTDLVIPDVNSDGEKVVAVGYGAFNDNDSIESVYIPATVTNIGAFAFDNCDKLYAFTVDETNERYKSVDGNLYGSFLFKLINYAIGKTDTEFTLPDGVTSIEYGAFYGSDFLVSITLSDTVEYINAYAFLECSQLSCLKANDGNPYFEDIDGNLYTKGEKRELVRYAPIQSKESFVIPEDVHSIGMMSFAGSLLNTVYVPAGVKEIGSYAFLDCINLENFCFTDETGGLSDITVIPLGIFSGCSKLKSFVIPEGIKVIDNSAFYNCAAIESITLPDSLEAINDYAFYGCTMLSEINFGKGLQTIGNSAFNGCIGLISLTLPDSLTAIGRSAFWGCDSLISVVLPLNLTSIDEFAFFCQNIAAAFYKGSAEEWDDLQFTPDSHFKNATVYFYSPDTPTETGHFWRYVDGVPTVWEESLPAPEN